MGAKICRETGSAQPASTSSVTKSQSEDTRHDSKTATKEMTASSPPTDVRNLHWVFKVGNRTETADFYVNILGMVPLRHEEFTAGCAAACNGPYAGLWSKTMIGYGDEDTNFVLELTYNYGVKKYEIGNDYDSITIKSKAAYATAQSKGLGTSVAGRPGALQVQAPDGYRFLLEDDDVAAGCCPITELALSVTDLAKSLDYWSGFLGFEVVDRSEGGALLSPGPDQCRLRLTALPPGTAMDHGTGFGRVAFSCPGGQLEPLQAAVRAAGYTVHTPYVSLDTPGKATVQVVILADPDGHEICFVGDEGFRDLSRRDPAAPELLRTKIEEDKSEEWHVKNEARLARIAAKQAAKKAKEEEEAAAGATAAGVGAAAAATVVASGGDSGGDGSGGDGGGGGGNDDGQVIVPPVDAGLCAGADCCVEASGGADCGSNGGGGGDSGGGGDCGGGGDSGGGGGSGGDCGGGD